MSAITIGGDLIHYEKLGRGRPIILLHGWVGSWIYWIPVMQQLQLKYRVYTIDLIGFGDSAKNPEKYTIDDQIDMLKQFMDQLGIPKAAFVGHGLGAMIIVEFALRYPDKVARAVLSSLPLFNTDDLANRIPAGKRIRLTSSNTTQRDELMASQIQSSAEIPSISSDDSDLTLPNNPLLDNSDATFVKPPVSDDKPFHELPTIGQISQQDRAKLLDRAQLNQPDMPSSLSDTTINSPLPPSPQDAPATENHLIDVFQGKTAKWLLERCFRRNESEFDKLAPHVEKCDMRAILKSAEGFDSGRMLDKIRLVKSPQLVVHGVDDPLLPVPGELVWNYISSEKSDSLIVIPAPNIRHFPMLEYAPFQRLVNDFLETSDLSKLEIREKWVRRNF